MTRLRSCLSFGPAIAFLRRRLSPEGYLGLYLTIGVAVLIGACWVFGEITEDVITGDPLTLVDRRVTRIEWRSTVRWLSASGKYHGRSLPHRRRRD